MRWDTGLPKPWSTLFGALGTPLALAAGARRFALKMWYSFVCVCQGCVGLGNPTWHAGPGFALWRWVLAKSKYNWITKRKKTEPEVPYESPVWLGDISNGEFYLPQGDRERRIRDLVLQRCDENARRKGMDRREFISSAMGMATTLSVLNLAAGCGNKDGMMSGGMMDRLMGQAGATPYDNGMTAAQMEEMGMIPGNTAMGAGASPGMIPTPTGGAAPTNTPAMPGMDAGMQPGMMPPMTGTPDGGFVITPEACMDEQMAEQLFSTEYFILDFQTHHTNEGMVGPCFTDNGGVDCTSPDTYIRQIFEESETTVAVLSGLPAAIDEATMDLSGFSFRNEDMRNSRDRVNAVAMVTPMAAERMVAHCQISPKNAPAANATMMEINKRMYDTRGWKCYPPTEGGWFLHENDEFIKTAIELDEPLVCVHKGFPFPGWSRVHADPMPDIAEAAMRYPQVNIVVYHSAYDSGHTEGAYDPNPNALDGGTDRLWKTISDNNLANKNVYAEMGSAWALSMRDPMVAQHYIGKALKFMGEDRVVWGSECVWFGSPQNQIEAMKVFRISEQFQEMYGYPEFTDTIRRKIFGLNGAPLYRVDPNACRYKVSRSQFAARRKMLDERWGPRRHAYNPPAIRSRREFIQLYRDRIARGEFA